MTLMTVATRMVGALPGPAFEATSRGPCLRRPTRQVILDPLESGANLVPQLLEPMAGCFLVLLQLDGSHASHPFDAE
jgi:hypothetical protein